MGIPKQLVGRITRRLTRTCFELETVRTLYRDLRYGGYCGGCETSRYARLGANGTISTEYGQLDELFRRSGIRITESDVLVDIGCGKGRVINYWLGKGYSNRIVGLELDEDVAIRLRGRVAAWPNVDIVTGDAVDRLPEDGTIFYAYNPFGERVMARLKAKMEDLYSPGRGVVLLYYNCHHVGLFADDSAWCVESLGWVGTLPAALVVLRERPAREERA